MAEKISKLEGIGEVIISIGEETDIETTIENVEKGIKSSFRFFDNITDLNFKIKFAYSREEFDEYVKEKTANWVVAHSFEDKFIIFAPEKIEQYTNHKKEEFSQIVCHETCHILTQKINHNFSFWMFEGIALNVANQIKKGEIKKENLDYFIDKCLFKNSNYKDFISHQGYLISYLLIKYFLENYSKNIIMSLLKINYNNNNFVEKEFCEIINMDKKRVVDIVNNILQNKKA